MMSQACTHLACNSSPGCTLPEGKCQALGKAALLSTSSNVAHKFFSGANFLLKTSPPSHSRAVSIKCKASNNNSRNPDFSRQRKGSSRGRNRRYQQRENSESVDETDPLSSKNGSLLSLSGNQRHSATATPGQREKEIVELFRKVQAQLRERAAIKEEKKIEASQQGQGQGERGTVDSLLKLLRKHSVAQGKKGKHDEEHNLEQPERSNSFGDQPNSTSRSITSSDAILDSNPVPFGRPTSKFRRRSPVPRVKFQPVFTADEGISTGSILKSGAKKKEIVNEIEPELEMLEEPDEEMLDELTDATDADETIEEEEEPSAVDTSELASLKLTELRDIAKSRGFKGYSKLKKAELVELLNRESS